MITILNSKYQSNQLVVLMPCEIGNNDKLHNHNYFEGVYVRRGEAVHILDGHRIKVSEGDFFIIDYDVPHKFEIDNGQSIEVVNVIFKPEMLDVSLKGCHTFKELCENYFIRLNVLSTVGKYYTCKDKNNILKNIIKKMILEFRSSEIGKIELLRSMLVELIINAVRLSENNEQYSQYNSVTVKILNLIEERFMENITISKLAKSNNYSVAFLSKAFKQDMGMGFKKYLDTVRLKQSEILLVRTDKKIIEISDSVGFPDVNRFYKLFKERYNATPKQYRLKFKNNSCD